MNSRGNVLNALLIENLPGNSSEKRNQKKIK